MLLNRLYSFYKSNLFKYMGAEFLGALISFLIATYVLIYFGARELGVLTFYLVLTSLFATLAQGASASFLMKYFFNKSQNNVVTSANLTLFVFSLFSFGIYWVTYPFFNDYYYTSYFIFFVITKAYNLNRFVIIRLNKDVNSFFVISILYRSLYASILLYLIYVDSFSLDNFFLVLFVNEVVFASVLSYWISAKYKYKVKFNKTMCINSMQLSLKLFPHKVFKNINDNIDKYAVQFILGLEALGIYVILLKLTQPIVVYIKSANNELSVLMSQAYAGLTFSENLLSLEKKIFVILVLMNILTITMATVYHLHIYNLGEDFLKLLFAVLAYVNLIMFYTIFYNENFYLTTKITYFFSFILFILSVSVLYFSNVRDLDELITILVIIKTSLILLLLVNTYKLTKLKISQYAFYFMSVIFLINNVWRM